MVRIGEAETPDGDHLHGWPDRSPSALQSRLNGEVTHSAGERHAQLSLGNLVMGSRKSGRTVT